MVGSYLNSHIETLVRQDANFASYWSSLTGEALASLREMWSAVEAEDITGSQYESAIDTTKRWFVRIQEKEFQYSKIPNDWMHLVRSEDAKRQLYERSMARLSEFALLSGIEGFRVYGGIKPEASLDRKILESRQGNAVQVNLLDLWDVVRFRIVAKDLDSLLELGVKFWEWHFDDILRCRNYYYRPRLGHSDDAYRAVHFELADNEEWMVEVQLMTHCREAVGRLDHAFLFKKTLSFIDEQHRKWLTDLSKKANVYEFRRASGPAYLRPGPEEGVL
jgi:hypothetical protein